MAARFELSVSHRDGAAGYTPRALRLTLGRDAGGGPCSRTWADIAKGDRLRRGQGAGPSAAAGDPRPAARDAQSDRNVHGMLYQRVQCANPPDTDCRHHEREPRSLIASAARPVWTQSQRATLAEVEVDNKACSLPTEATTATLKWAIQSAVYWWG
jgi:hypothetical protein